MTEGYQNTADKLSAYSAANVTVKKTRQVVMLYDGLIKIVKQAKQAIEDNELEKRYNLIEKACQIVAGLHASLDHEKGGEIAVLLNDYYEAIEYRLMSVQGNNRLDLCDQVLKELKIMRGAWEQVDKKFESGELEAENAQAAATAATAPQAPEANPAQDVALESEALAEAAVEEVAPEEVEEIMAEEAEDTVETPVNADKARALAQYQNISVSV